jgi:putative FmdB family regulatory protein
MPIYEYACQACGRHFEKLVHAQSTVACPACESPRVSRQLSVVGVRTGSRFGVESSAAPASGGGGCCGGGCGCH